MDFYDTICRLCEASDKLNEKWQNVFSAEGSQLLAKIKYCTNLEIHKKDKLPKRICGSCQKKLEQAYSFKIQCEITDAKLKHEINFLEKNNWNTTLTIPPFDCDNFNHVVKEETETLPTVSSPPLAEPVFIKAEIVETHQIENDASSEDENLCMAKVEVRLDSEPTKAAIDDDGSSDRSIQSDGAEDSDDENPSDVKPSKERLIICETCGKQFNKRSLLYAHMRAVHNKRKYQCTECPRSFSRKSRLEDHKLKHLGIRQFECSFCDRKYSSQQGLKNHVDDYHNHDLPYVCDKCGKAFSKESKLRHHYSLHIESRNFLCGVCSKGFKTQAHLNVHMNVHLPEDQKKTRKRHDRKKVCVCPFCGKVSNSIGTHTMHIRTHTGEQRYECHVCFKRFTSSGSHKKHLRVHSGEKPYECEFCQKQFRQKHHMTTHIRGVHTNEKPYKCKYCPRAFATRGNMTLHERSHGGSDPVIEGGLVVDTATLADESKQGALAAQVSSIEADLDGGSPRSSPMVSAGPLPMMSAAALVVMPQPEMYFHSS